MLVQAPAVWLPDPPPGRDRFLTRPEAARLLRAARRQPKARDHLTLFILVALYVGARKEAILSLQWQPNITGGYVDLEAGVIDFNPLGRPGTKKQRAVARIPSRLLRFLKVARGRTRQYVIEFDMQPVKSIKRSFRTACRDAGLVDVTPHILKHTCITWLLQAGEEIWQIAGLTGTTKATIEDRYGHHAPDYQLQAAESRRRPATQPVIQPATGLNGRA